MRTVAIVNPIAGHQRAPRTWPRLLEALGSKAASVVTWWSEYPGHAEVLAARARRQGFARVVAVGGDGTLLEVVNGLWWEPAGELPGVGTVPFGTGCDYVRNFPPRRGQLDHLATALGEATAPVDVGLCRLQGLDGKPWRRIFINVLGLGFDANVVDRFRRRRFPFAGKTAYFLCGGLELLRLKQYRLQGEIDGKTLQTDAQMLVIGLGRHFGGGMMIAPHAAPHSGRFQVVWSRHLSRLEVLLLLPKIYAGKHLHHPQIHATFARRLSLLTDPPAYVEAEGELVGRTPLEVELCPGALRFACNS